MTVFDSKFNHDEDNGVELDEAVAKVEKLVVSGVEAYRKVILDSF